MTAEEKAPFVEIEEKAREKYKVAVEKWKKQKAERKAADQQAALQEAEFQQEALHQEGFHHDGLQAQPDFMFNPSYFAGDSLTSNTGAMNPSYIMQPSIYHGQHFNGA